MRKAFGHLLEILGLLSMLVALPMAWLSVVEPMLIIDALKHGGASFAHQWPIWVLLSFPLMAGLVFFGAGYHLVRSEARRLEKRAPKLTPRD